MEHKHSLEEERKIREAALDETLAESFPASDAPSTLPNPEDDTQFDEEKKEEDRRKPPPRRK